MTPADLAPQIRQAWPAASLPAKAALGVAERCEGLAQRAAVKMWLANARYWRGPEARRIKAELRRWLSCQR